MEPKTTVIEVDAATAALLCHLAESWGVSREEAVRRAVNDAKSADVKEKLRALAELQDHLRLTADKARAWHLSVREARR